MNNILELASKPLSFSFLLAIAVGSALYQSSRRTVPQAEKAAEAELMLVAHRVGNAYLVSEWHDRSKGARAALENALQEAVRHPRVTAAVASTSSGEIIGSVAEDNLPRLRGKQFVLPLTDGYNHPVGTVSFDLLGDSMAGENLQRQVILFPLAGALIAFFGSFALLRRREGFLPSLITAIRKVSSGQLDVSLSVPNDDELADLARAFNAMVEGLQERDRMRHSLGRIMDPKIAEILIKENPKVGGLRRNATILFCDIRNYTSICEQLSTDELQLFLNEYWKETVEIIMEQEGTIDKFHGDGVCVVFGAPVLHEDDAVRAVRTAARLVENVERLNKRREAQRKTPIQIGVGIHTGEVIAGHIGSERRMDYTVVGDAVNVAARIEELNKKFGTKILISDSVYEKVESHVRVKTLTLAYLRGHKRPILVHALREFIEDAAVQTPTEEAA